MDERVTRYASQDGVDILQVEPDGRAKGFFDPEELDDAVIIHAVEDNDNSSEAVCLEDLMKLAKRNRGISKEVVLRIRYSSIENRDYMNKGIGAAMYVVAAMIARDEGHAIAADGCFKDEQAATSRYAARVWAGRKLRKYCDVEGWCAVFKAKGRIR